ncbi:hypothetical protein HUU05_09810 [candidate division KSB1 bacterium]|nr:hypothetical protein [candidate division KSB1 bacterium]
MTREEAVNKNLELSFEFDRYLFEHPKFAEKIPDNALVVLLPQYDEELREYNLEIANKNREPDQPMVIVEIASLKPQKSRLTRPRLKVFAKASPMKSRVREQRAFAAQS